MPTYEYRCKECGADLEVVQSFTDDPLTTCERCGGPLRKVFGSVGISFKGSGFYKTDSRSTGGSSSTKATGDGSSSSKDSGSSGEGGSSTATGDTKPTGSADKAAATTSTTT